MGKPFLRASLASARSSVNRDKSWIICYHWALMPQVEPTALSRLAQSPARGVNQVKHSPAITKLRSSCARTSSLLSVGLEPCEAYLPRGFEPTIEGYERFLMSIVDAGAQAAAAFKFNLAFFEALGPKGWDLLFRVRARLPAEAYIIADAKRSDIGSTAKHYAKALFDELGADAATVNPLMGRDAVEPFLEYEDKLTFLLTLTSNPGAEDFLVPGGLYKSIATKANAWNTRGNVGLVVGATQPERMGEIRQLVRDAPMLVPGVGAQGGSLQHAAQAGRAEGDWPAMLFHVTRGVLPGAEDNGEPTEVIRLKIDQWRERIAHATSWNGDNGKAGETPAPLDRAAS